MDITIYPRKLQGYVNAIPSKSHAHRLLICAAFSDGETILECPETNADIEATAGCLNALGACITRTNGGYRVLPVKSVPAAAKLDCGESGSTLRFMLPIVCALGINATIKMSGRLPYRPLSPLWEELIKMGCSLSRPTDDTILTTGKLKAGEYCIAGNVSSQFITGLLFAVSMIEGSSCIKVIGTLESEPYVKMTQDALSAFGVTSDNFHINGCLPFHTPGSVRVEGDWSNAAFYLAADALGHDIQVKNLNLHSSQGDRAIIDILKKSHQFPTICARDIPDLIPILAVYFAVNGGAVFTDIARLRLKESDRVASIMNLLRSLGIQSEATDETLTVHHGAYTSGIVDACNDHRIAMAAAIAATIASGPVTVLGAECVAKSYPTFWKVYQQLGGKYEQYLR